MTKVYYENKANYQEYARTKIFTERSFGYIYSKQYIKQLLKLKCSYKFIHTFN